MKDKRNDKFNPITMNQIRGTSIILVSRNWGIILISYHRTAVIVCILVFRCVRM